MGTNVPSLLNRERIPVSSVAEFQPRSSRYGMKLVGNSPEICRGLDSHGFADLKHSGRINSAMTSAYDLGDSRRFDLSTVNSRSKSKREDFRFIPAENIRFDS